MHICCSWPLLHNPDQSHTDKSRKRVQGNPTVLPLPAVTSRLSVAGSVTHVGAASPRALCSFLGHHWALCPGNSPAAHSSARCRGCWCRAWPDGGIRLGAGGGRPTEAASACGPLCGVPSCGKGSWTPGKPRLSWPCWSLEVVLEST